MKKLVALICLVSLAAGSSFAQVDPDPSGLGVFFDTGATVTEMTNMAPYSMFAIHVVATRISTPAGLQGFEFELTRAGATLLADPIIVPSTVFIGTNYGSPPEYIVGSGQVLPYADAIVLLTDNLMNFAAPGKVQWFLGPIAAPTIAGTCAYSDGGNEEIVVAFQPSNGDWNLPAAILNPDEGEVVIATEESTWGGVKNLYR